MVKKVKVYQTSDQKMEVNAIYDAIGVRINNLPMTPEKILDALKAKKKV